MLDLYSYCNVHLSHLSYLISFQKLGHQQVWNTVQMYIFEKESFTWTGHLSSDIECQTKNHVPRLCQGLAPSTIDLSTTSEFNDQPIWNPGPPKQQQTWSRPADYSNLFLGVDITGYVRQDQGVFRSVLEAEILEVDVSVRGPLRGRTGLLDSKGALLLGVLSGDDGVVKCATFVL